MVLTIAYVCFTSQSGVPTAADPETRWPILKLAQSFVDGEALPTLSLVLTPLQKRLLTSAPSLRARKTHQVTLRLI